MKKKILISLFLLPQIFFAQLKITSFTPSAYYTYGSYDNNTLSNGVTALAALGFNYKDYLTFGYDAIKIDNDLWKYDQKMGTVSATKNLYPFYVNAVYSYLEGAFDYKPFPYNYTDYINIYSVKVTYNFGLNFISFGGDYQNVNGFFDLVNRHYEIGFSRLIGTKLNLSAGITKSVISDSRNLTAFTLGGTYRLDNKLSFSAGLMLGKRAYYYNSLLLTYFNQNETQKGNISAGVSYIFTDRLKLNGSYTGSKFDGYTINYFSVGAGYYF